MIQILSGSSASSEPGVDQYRQHQRTGRRCIVRPSTVAEVAGMDERTVQRCRQAARALGLRVEVFPGRMLTLTECTTARRRGCRQRGLSAEAAFTIPNPLRGAVADRRSAHRCVMTALLDGR